MQTQRSNWRGGPRPPIAVAHRVSRTRDDLEVRNSQHPFLDCSIDITRSSRRRALDAETEQRWQQMLQIDQSPASVRPSPASTSSSPVDSRWHFFGPRQPRRTSRASPLTPHTPHTPFTPHTPYTPELETPADEVQESFVLTQKFAESDSDDGSLHGPEFLITPFLLRQPTNEPTPSRRNPITSERSAAVEAHVTPMAIPPQSDNTKRPSRPRLSIITWSSWSTRTSTSSRELQVPREPVPSFSISNEAPTVLARLTESLVADVLQDQQKYRILLAFRGNEAQHILDCLQLVLDSPSLRNPDRAVILRALTRLSTRSGLYPGCFKLQGIETLGNEPVDEGRYGDVWKGTFHGHPVCLKVLRTYQRMPTQPLLKNLSHEALLWGQLSHPNILPFYGIYINEVRRNRFGLVSPWMENGNIVNYLKHNPQVLRIPLIHDIASGLQYLHSLNVVHGDIKGTNILVTYTGRACLADFGLSTLLGDNILVWPSLGSEPGRGGGTTRWRAPELFIQEYKDTDPVPTPSTDVYSFACVAYEVITGQIPFYEIRGEGAMILAKLSDPCVKPTRPAPEQASKELTDELWCLLQDCWNFEPVDRPSLEEVLLRLEEMMTPQQIRASRNGHTTVDAWVHGSTVLSSSRFRKSFNENNQPSDEDLLKAISMIYL